MRGFFSGSGLRRFLVLAERGIKPGPSERPVAIGRAADDAHCLGRLVEREPGEEAELDQLGTVRIFLRELVQGVVEEEKLVRGFRDGERMRRMASAAAAKKCRRPSQCCSLGGSRLPLAGLTSRRYAS